MFLILIFEDLKTTEVVRELAARWRAMNFEEKTIYLDESLKLKQQKIEELKTLFPSDDEKKAFEKRKLELARERRKQLSSRRIKRV